MRYGDADLEESGWRVTAARFISRLTPAPLVNLYVGALMAFSRPDLLGPTLTVWSALAVCLVFMVVVPVLPILWHARRGLIDLDVSRRETRPKFFLFAIASYACAALLYALTACHIMFVLAVAYIFVTLGVLAANSVSKVSVHCAGVSGPGTALVCVFGAPALWVVLLWAVVLWARNTLRQHTFVETIAGLLIGMLVTLPVYVLLNGCGV